MNPPATPWLSTEPPTDGTEIVAMGNITTYWPDDGSVDVCPFLEHLRWSGEEWICRDGMTVRVHDTANVTIHYWLPSPP